MIRCLYMLDNVISWRRSIFSSTPMRKSCLYPYEFSATWGERKMLRGRVLNISANIPSKYFEALTNHLCKIAALSLCTITFLFQERNGEKHINGWAQRRRYFWNNGEVIIQQALFAHKDVLPLKPREYLLEKVPLRRKKRKEKEKVPLAEVYIDFCFGISGLPAWLDRRVKL